jgi:predicted transcriptional regulator
MNGSDHNQTTWAEDEGVESVVLQQLLDLHPTRLTMNELLREVSGNRGSFAERDAVSRAVRELVAVGLLHKEAEEFVTPTRAALRFSELLER